MIEKHQHDSIVPMTLQPFNYILTLILVFLLVGSILSGQKVAEPFEFEFEKKILRGLIEKPRHEISRAVVIIIPGYGRTDFVDGNWFSTLRNTLVASGLTVCFWDKMGCGKSEGEFDAQQPVENSAREAIAAILEIQRLSIPGSDKIGLWGISRAGWISPLINELFAIDFWISVSGTDDKENFGYLLKSNLMIAGKPENEAEKLYQSWLLGHRIFCTHGIYEDYLDAVQPLRQDSTCRRLFGYTKEPGNFEEGRIAYLHEQQSFTTNGYFDTESGLWVYIDKFGEILAKMNCPVLALFGANDSQVNWRNTKQLYEKSIGARPDSDLTIKVFENCNHNLQKCISCAYQEDLSASKWQACDHYYDTMIDWLKIHNFIK